MVRAVSVGCPPNFTVKKKGCGLCRSPNISAIRKLFYMVRNL